MHLNNKLTFKAVALSSLITLTGCGGDSSYTESNSEEPIQLSVSTTHTSVENLVENNSVSIPFTYNYNGTSPLSFTITSSHQFLTVDTNEQAIQITALEVNEDQEESVVLTVAGGELSQTITVDLLVKDEATNYEFNHSGSQTQVRGNIASVDFVLPLELNKQFDTHTNGALLVNFAEGNTNYASLSDFDVESNNNDLIDIDGNLITGQSVGEGTLTLSTVNYSGSLTYQVIDPAPKISGTLTFDRINVVDFGNAELILDADNPVKTSLANVYTYLLDQDGTVIQTTTTDALGRYEFDLEETDLNKVFDIQFESKLLISGDLNNGFFIQVKDQSTGDSFEEHQPYSKVIEDITVVKGNSLQNLHLHSGWDSEARRFPYEKVDGQPFAILDSINKATNFIKNSGRPIPADSPDLLVSWTKHPDHVEGNAAYYSPMNNRILLNGTLDEFTAIYEWNETVIVHEFGHYYMKQILGRDDSRGGMHSELTPSGLRIAFSEGFATALANATLDNWLDLRVLDDDPTVRGKYYDDPMLLNLNGIDPSRRTQITDFDGNMITRPSEVISAWDERSVAFFIASFIDEKAGDNYFTSDLVDEVGFAKLHDILKEFIKTESLLNLYGLANQVKLTMPELSDEVDALGIKLNAKFVNEWSAGEDAVNSILIGEETPLDPESYLPLYEELDESGATEVCFNGGYLGMNLRPGMVRFAKFTAEVDRNTIIKAPSVTDSRGYEHKFSINVLDKGEYAKEHNLFKDGLDTTYFEAEAGKTYSIVVTDETMRELYQRTYDETYCTNISAYEFVEQQ